MSKELNRKAFFNISMIAIIGNFFAGFLNYFFHFVSGKILSTASFSQFEGVISLFSIVGVVTGAIGPVVVAKLSQAKDPSDRNQKFHSFKNFIYVFSIISSIFLLILFPVFNQLLKLDNFYIYLIFVFQTAVSIIYIFYLSSLQAELKIGEYLIYGISFSVVKLLLLWIFSLTPLAQYSSNISFALAFLIIALVAGRNISIRHPKPLNISKITPNEILSFSIISLFTNFFVTTSYNQDTLLARFFLSETESGLYASVSLIGKIIFFFSSAILIALYPVFSRNIGKKTNIKYFLLGYAFIILSCFAFIIAYHLLPTFITLTLFGQKFIVAAQYVPQISIFMCLYSLYYYSVQFLLSQQSKLAAIISGTTTLLQAIFIYFNHSSISTLITSLTLPLILMTIVALLPALYIASVDSKHHEP